MMGPSICSSRKSEYPPGPYPTPTLPYPGIGVLFLMILSPEGYNARTEMVMGRNTPKRKRNATVGNIHLIRD